MCVLAVININVFLVVRAHNIFHMLNECRSHVQGCEIHLYLLLV